VLQLDFVVGAEDEIREATEWLEDQSSGLGDRLLDEVERAILLIRRQPNLGSPVKGVEGVRKMLLHRFRYVLIYRVHGEILQIISLMHTSRKPGYWIDRI
jgi:plasmid stabilization system protein ParE